jgi:hypothetical protein
MSEEIARLMKTLRRIESECAEGGDELAEMGEGPLLESAPGVRGISFAMSCSAVIPLSIVGFIVEFTNSVWLLLFFFFFFSCPSCLFCHMSSSRRRRRRPLCLRRQRRCGGMPRRATDRRRPRLWSSAERLQTIPSQAETPIKREENKQTTTKKKKKKKKKEVEWGMVVFYRCFSFVPVPTIISFFFIEFHFTPFLSKAIL